MPSRFIEPVIAGNLLSAMRAKLGTPKAITAVTYTSVHNRPVVIAQCKTRHRIDGERASDDTLAEYRNQTSPM
jgi:hypothetical protein